MNENVNEKVQRKSTEIVQGESSERNQRRKLESEHKKRKWSRKVKLESRMRNLREKVVRERMSNVIFCQTKRIKSLCSLGLLYNNNITPTIIDYELYEVVLS